MAGKRLSHKISFVLSTALIHLSEILAVVAWAVVNLEVFVSQLNVFAPIAGKAIRGYSSVSADHRDWYQLHPLMSSGAMRFHSGKAGLLLLQLLVKSMVLGQQFAVLTRDDEFESWNLWLSTASDTWGDEVVEDGMSRNYYTLILVHLWEFVGKFPQHTNSLSKHFPVGSVCH